MTSQFNWYVAIGIFIGYAVVDALYAYYTLSVTRLNAKTAATVGAGMHFILALGVLGYTKNYLYVIPLAIGSWIGTYTLISYQKSNGKAAKTSEKTVVD